MRRLAVLLAAVFAALVLASCGGGGGGGGTTTEPPPPQPQPSVIFTPQGAAGVNSIFLASSVATTANTLFLEVRTNQVVDVYGVAFDLSYPSAVLEFTRVTAGPLLGASGSVQAAASSPGSLIVGGTHLGGVPGATGSGVLMTLEFRVLAAGQGDFRFSRNSALDSSGQPVGGTAWVGGSVTVTR